MQGAWLPSPDTSVLTKILLLKCQIGKRNSVWRLAKPSVPSPKPFSMPPSVVTITHRRDPWPGQEPHRPSSSRPCMSSCRAQNLSSDRNIDILGFSGTFKSVLTFHFTTTFRWASRIIPIVFFVLEECYVPPLTLPRSCFISFLPAALVSSSPQLLAGADPCSPAADSLYARSCIILVSKVQIETEML